MDLAVLPEIFAVSLVIAAYRPLVRRVGAHVNLWLLGWCFLLAYYVSRFLAGVARSSGPALSSLGMALIELCGLAFILATANARMRRVGLLFITELALPLLAQAGLGVFGTGRGPGFDRLHYSVQALFLLPAIPLVVNASSRRRGRALVGAAFAVYGLLSLPVAASRPELVTAGALALLFLSVAYLYLSNTPRHSRGVLATGLGLAGWGLSYPLAAAVAHFYPQYAIDRRVLEMPRYMVMAGSILTLLEEHLQRTERMATHDPLTDLPNRRRFEERFAEALTEAREERTTVACLVIDVDDFKRINDTLGHTAGDQLLTSLAVRLSWHISARDILARTGGDEFTAMLAGVSDEHHLRFIASAMMSAASVPVIVEGRPVDVRISVGIALSPDDADDMDGLLKMADEAMYRAKRRGGNLLVFAGESQGEDAAEDAADHARIAAAAGQAAHGGRAHAGQILRMNSPRSRTH